MARGKQSQRKETAHSKEGKNPKSFSKDTKKVEGKAVPNIVSVQGNPYADEFNALKKNEEHFDDLLTGDFEGDLDEALSTLYEKTSKLCEKYAWAIPDDRVLRILESFSPIVEVGAGKGYWASLLRQRGVDILAYDKFCYTKNIKANSDKKNKSDVPTFTEVLRGGPEVLQQPETTHRNLFLCYPDEAESMAADCLDQVLQHHTAEYILHVGENISTGTVLGPPTAPFGRTSSADFQVSLAESHHCVLVVELKHRYPISRDCLTVWKRTRYVSAADGMESGESGEEGEDSEEDGSQEGESEEDGEDEEEEEEDEEGEVGEEAGLGVSQKSGKAGDGVVGGVEYFSPADLQKMREAALDAQYAEDAPAMWAVIPLEERLPLDRAAPCMEHLLR